MDIQILSAKNSLVVAKGTVPLPTEAVVLLPRSSLAQQNRMLCPLSFVGALADPPHSFCPNRLPAHCLAGETMGSWEQHKV